ncbi:MAG: VTT domain-containing protein [Leptospira sp.]|nr:VTT domain-containing protein [Leptospira sp.]
MELNNSQPKSQKKNQYDAFFYQKISKNAIFEYRKKEKHLNAVLLWLSLSSIVILGILFYLLPMETLFKDTLLGDIFNYFLSQFTSRTLFGVYLTSLFGGLFFLMFPLELYFFAMLQEVQDPEYYLIIYFMGVFSAQTLNYWLGLRAYRICKIIIPPQKFYKMKGSLNRWGVWMILFMNMLPLPSPVFSTALGAFRYNFRRFLVFMGIGSFILYLSMFLIVKYMLAYDFEELSWIKF